MATTTAPRDVSAKVRAFYEETSFPGYEDYEGTYDLVRKATEGQYARQLDEEVPLGVRVLDAGCGTGQLSVFLSLTNRKVFGVDLSYNSLHKGQEFKEREGLKDVHFTQMNLFKPCLRPASFDYVFSNGVLHHTGDAFGAFKNLVEVLKPGGHIVIGLYNTYGRLFLDLRRVIFKVTGDRFTWLDYFVRSKIRGDRKKQIWFLDQYKNPHETKLSVHHVLAWFDACGIEYVNSVPPINPGVAGEPDRLFVPRPAGRPFTHLLTQLGWIFTEGREGGFFIIIGRKKEDAP